MPLSVSNLLRIVMLIALVALATGFPASAQESEHDFFEKRIRPLLIEKCISCHGSEQQESALRLDSRAAMLNGGERGAAVQLDAPKTSLLLTAITHRDDDLQMPPDERLNDDQITALNQWIQSGAAWPDNRATLQQSFEARIVHAKQNHWSFQPIRKPLPPQIDNKDWVGNPIDAFVLTKLIESGIEPSRLTDEYTLVRRLFFDLTGLPPTMADVQSFELSESPDRIPELIDDLLSRPQYGERWARHWLDVARYADTQGYAFDKDRKYPHAYTYRDYVIDAFNEDLAYDRFLLEQLAADQLELGDDLRPLAGLGFITVGRKFIDSKDTLDDQIDVVTRGLMGLTVSCARCHDHKYDPIPTADYYSLQGVFASSREPEIRPAIGDREEVEKFEAFQKQLRDYQSEFDHFRNEQLADQKKQTTERLGDYFFAAFDPAIKSAAEKNAAQQQEPDDLRPRMIARWQKKLEEYANLDAFKPWTELRLLPDEEFVEASAKKLEAWSGSKTSRGSKSQFTIDIEQRLQQANITTKKEIAMVYAEMVRETWQAFDKFGGNDDAILKIDERLRPFVKLRRNEDSPLNVSIGEIQYYLNQSELVEFERLTQELSEYRKQSPPVLPRAMSLVDKQNPVQPYVYLRGDPHAAGASVPRQFLAVLSNDERTPFPNAASGRLQLAHEIISPENPLTARVIVNRVWMHHFGTPLVETPSDFGARCAKPVHHELLDYLASYLQENKWSLKSLHRLILTSRTWQQSSLNRAKALEVDSQNSLYWRANRRRLEWEAVRDSLYSVSGELDLTLGGPAIDMFRSKPSNRRSIYGFIDRQDLPNLLRSFDFASPDQSSAARPNTTVPQQALYLMNGPLVGQLAGKLINQKEFTENADDPVRLQWLYHRLYARAPTKEELKVGLEFLNESELNEETRKKRWQSLAQALLMTNEFSFVD